MRWLDLLFLHWPIASHEIQSRLPAGMEVDTFEGSAWIGVVPFFMSHTRPRFLPSIPVVGDFAELNVRTYVRVKGVPGVYFFSLDACSPLAVTMARKIFHLPYRHAQMDASRDGDWIVYQSHRTDPLDPGADLKVRYRCTSPLQTPTAGTLESFLTDRWCLFSATPAGHIFRGEVHHASWQLGTAQVHIEKDTMTEFLQLDRPDSRPHAMFSPGLEVRAWMPQRIV